MAFRDLHNGILEEFAEWASRYAEVSDASVALIEIKRMRDVEYQRDRRAKLRLRRVRTERRLCAHCGRLFTVREHTKPGPYQAYCSERCRFAERVDRRVRGSGQLGL